MVMSLSLPTLARGVTRIKGAISVRQSLAEKFLDLTLARTKLAVPTSTYDDLFAIHEGAVYEA